MEKSEKFQSFDKLRIDPEQSRMGQREKIGEPRYLNKNCWLVKNLNYAPYKRCQYCELKFRNCLFLHYQIISLILILFLLPLSFLIEGKISELIIISVFTLVIVYGYFFNKSTNKIIQANFAQRKAKEALEELTKNLQQKVDEQTKKIREAYKKLSKAYNEIKAKNIHLEKLLKMRSEFLDVASHQLRTPVSVIKGVLEMLTLGELERLPKETKEMQLQAAFSKSKKLEQIISDILDASEMDTKPFKLNSKIARKIKVEELLERIVKTYQLEAKNKGVDLQFQKPSGPFPEILGEERYLEQAIVNLMDNAIKYTPAKNEKTKEKGKVLIKAEKDGNNIVVAVKDNGIGIPEKEIPELFEKFSRASNAKEMYTDGTGLGLFIAQEIIRGHHGKVTMESKFDLGTTFKIILPIAK